MASQAKVFNPTDPSTPGHYGPSQTALLLMDFHSLLVEKFGGSNAPAASRVAADMRRWAKSQGIVVIHALLDLESTPFPTCKDADRFHGVLTMMKGASGEEPADLRQQNDSNDSNEVTFTRRLGYVSALKSPGLEAFLQKRGITSLILTGLSTSGCVMRTAITASDAEYVVTVISDGCADPEEGVHEVVVEKLLNRGFATTAAEFQAGFAAAEKARSG